jgi:hypothetical protein
MAAGFGPWDVDGPRPPSFSLFFFLSSRARANAHAGTSVLRGMGWMPRRARCTFWSPTCLNPDGPVSLNNAAGNETRLMTFVRLWIFCCGLCLFFPCLELGVVKRNTRTMY